MPIITVVTPCQLTGVQSGSQPIWASRCVWMSTKPGVTRWASASISCRPLPIPELVRPILAALCAGRSPEQPVFANRKGELPIDPHNVPNRLFKKLGRQLGFKVNWPRFRHSAATFLDYLGADRGDAKALMGQRSDRALAIYTHPLERQRLLVEEVGERLMKTTEVVN